MNNHMKSNTIKGVKLLLKVWVGGKNARPGLRPIVLNCVSTVGCMCRMLVNFRPCVPSLKDAISPNKPFTGDLFLFNQMQVDIF